MRGYHNAMTTRDRSMLSVSPGRSHIHQAASVSPQIRLSPMPSSSDTFNQLTRGLTAPHRNRLESNTMMTDGVASVARKQGACLRCKRLKRKVRWVGLADAWLQFHTSQSELTYLFSVTRSNHSALSARRSTRNVVCRCFASILSRIRRYCSRDHGDNVIELQVSARFIPNKP